MGGFARKGDRIEVLLDGDERRLVALALRVLEGLDPDGDAPGAGRLRFCAHADDEDADERFRLLTEGMLEEAREADRAILDRTLRNHRISFEEAESWMRVIGEARLVLGARAGITTDGWEEEIAARPSPPVELIVIDLLGRVQDGLVRVMLD